MTTGASMSITFSDPDNTDQHWLQTSVYAYTGYDTSSPIGGTAAGTVSGQSSLTLSSAPALTSDVLGAISTDGGPGTVPGSGFSEIDHIGVAFNSYLEVEERTNSISQTVDWTPEGTLANPAAVEIKAAPAAPAATGRIIRLQGHIQLHGHVQFGM